MKYLKDNYKIIAIDDEYHNRLDEDTISITFDDGYKDNLYALEVCDKYDIDFTLYITTAEIGKDEYLSSDDIKVLDSSQRCIIGTHSVTHPHLDRLSYEEQYRELNESKKVLEDILCKSIYDMSYPHGSYNSDTLDIVQKLGYTRVGSSHIGINNKDSYNNLIIKRLEVVASDTTDKLKKMIDGYYDFL
jgi:peptidoglycan/xylan/chitin deacetylase (PgdA/CDA1 family)